MIRIDIKMMHDTENRSYKIEFIFSIWFNLEIDRKILVAKELRFLRLSRFCCFHRVFNKNGCVSLTDFSFNGRSAGFHEGAAARRGISLLISLLRLASNIPQHSHQISFQSFANVVLSTTVSYKVTGNSLLATFVLDIRCAHSLLYLPHVYRLVTELRARWWDKSNVAEDIFDRYFCFYDVDISKRIELEICLNIT